MAYSPIEYNSTVLEAINDAYGSLWDLRGDIDSALASAINTSAEHLPRVEMLLEAADFLEDSEHAPDISAAVADLAVSATIHLDLKNKNRISRKGQRDNAVNVLLSVVDTLDRWAAENPDHPDVDDTDSVKQRLSGFITVIEGAQFPATLRK